MEDESLVLILLTLIGLTERRTDIDMGFSYVILAADHSKKEAVLTNNM